MEECIGGGLEPCNSGSSAAVHWVCYSSNAVDTALECEWSSDQDGALEQYSGGRIGAVMWRDNSSSAMEGALEQCHGGRTGEVQLKLHGSCDSRQTGAVQWKEQ